jgi:hypothetical protein
LRQNFAVSEPQHYITFRPQESGTRCIPFNLVRVLCAVDFDTYARLNRCEIRNVTTNRMLPPELDAHLRRAQFAPQLLLGIRHL